MPAHPTFLVRPYSRLSMVDPGALLSHPLLAWGRVIGSRALAEESYVRTAPRPSRWAAVAMILGGAWLIAVWPVFTTLHGPTSVDEGGELFGGGVLFWGSLLEGPSGALIALGLAGSYRMLTGSGGWKARVGFALAMFGLVIPTTFNLAFQGQVPPLLAPLFGAGLILIMAGNRAGSWLTTFERRLLLGQGVILIYSGLWFLVVRPDVLDRIYGYRIYGVVANVLFGVGWILFGSSLMKRGRGAGAREPAAVTASR